MNYSVTSHKVRSWRNESRASLKLRSQKNSSKISLKMQSRRLFWSRPKMSMLLIEERKESPKEVYKRNIASETVWSGCRITLIHKTLRATTAFGNSWAKWNTGQLPVLFQTEGHIPGFTGLAVLAGRSKPPSGHSWLLAAVLGLLHRANQHAKFCSGVMQWINNTERKDKRERFFVCFEKRFLKINLLYLHFSHMTRWWDDEWKWQVTTQKFVSIANFRGSD